jgi:hypothetical protein
MLKKNEKKSSLKLIGHLQPRHEGTRLVDDVGVLEGRLGKDIRILSPLLGVQALEADAEVHEVVEGDPVKHLGLQSVATGGQHNL